MSNIIENLHWRYATKRMNGSKIPDNDLETILRVIQLAPSSFGLTPYSVIVVEDAETKAKLSPQFHNQPQILESSAVLIFANKTKIDDTTVDEYISEVAEKRGMELFQMGDFSNYLKSTIGKMSDEQKQIWASKQTYIALGFGLIGAAEVKVDATPMEGFIPSGVNEVLGLDELGLNASVALTLGYRDSENDYLVNQKKVRRNFEKLFIKK